MGIRDDTLELRSTLLDEALAILEADYAEPLELDDVARRVLTSRRQMQRIFTEVHGSPFRTALREVRMRNAIELLDHSDLPVGEIARQVGYTQPAQFAKAFRRMHSVSPTEYRASTAPAV
jgi:transcriptional regulator GlxA family with amidase domain